MGLFDKFKKKNDADEAYLTDADTAEKKPEPVAFGTYEGRIDARFRQLFPGREAFVFSEKISEGFRVDIKVLEPTSAGNYYVLYTVGLSDLSDRDPAELFCFLPASWNPVAVMEGGDSAPANVSWPIRMVREIARVMRENGEAAENGTPFACGGNFTPLCSDTKMSGYILSELEGEIGGIETEGGTRVRFLMAIPAYREEIRYRMKYGMDELNRRFDEGRLPMVTNLRRPNLCANFDGDE